MVQDIISGVAILILSTLIIIVQKRNRERRSYEKKQLEHLNSLLTYQSEHIDETRELNCTIKEMNKEIVLSRIDSRCAVYALRKASNGIKFKEYIEEERNRLMTEYNFKYKD